MNLRTAPRPAVALLALAGAFALHAQSPPAPPPTPAAPHSAVGMPAVIEDLVLPGGELEAAPAAPASKIIVRIEDTARHGTAFRYRIWFTGLEPGQYDLGEAKRPAHIHYKVSAESHRSLTTQLYFQGDAWLDRDPFVRKSLIVSRRCRSTWSYQFDIVLAKA